MSAAAVRLGAAALLFACPWSPAWAACSVQSAGLAFGSYDTLAGVPLDSTGNIQVECDADTAFTLDLGAGSGSYGQRTLSGAQSVLDYNLYTDAARTLIWADGLAGDDVSASGTSVSIPVYGRIPQRQNVAAGIYADTVVITISY